MVSTLQPAKLPQLIRRLYCRCSYGCNKGHSIRDRIEEHESAALDRPDIVPVQSPEPGNKRFLSVASFWEAAIKASTGKLKRHSSAEQLVQVQILGNAINLLPISARHLDRVQNLPFRHKDPSTGSSSPKP